MTKKFRHPTEEELKQESEEWNTWQPGSGRKGWSPFDKPIPEVRDSFTGHPVKNGKIDWKRVIEESNERHDG